jgi:hypothetical protein
MFCEKETKAGLLVRGFALLVVLAALPGCGVLKPKQQEQLPSVEELTAKPLPPEEAKGLLKDLGKNWFYGQGLGETALTVGTIVVFPPYAIYVLGNGALSMSGYEPLHVTDALPDEEKRQWNQIYDGVTQTPGRVSAAVAGEEYRTPEEAKARIDKYLEKNRAAQPEARAKETHSPLAGKE